MRVNGKWLPCDDGVVRPLIGGLVHLADGREIEVAFLLDAGADRTVFSPDFYALLQPLEVAEAESMRLAGGRAGKFHHSRNRHQLPPG